LRRLQNALSPSWQRPLSEKVAPEVRLWKNDQTKGLDAVAQALN